MANLLIGLHAGLGELGILAFIWIFVEMLKPTPSRVRRAKIAAILGIILFFLSWTIGGYYYVNYYGDVKTVIKEGPQPWAHLIFTETKEHVFLFLPFLSIFTYVIINNYQRSLSQDKNQKAKKAILSMSALVVVIGALMAFMGYLISSGFRTALEVGAG